jgi:hypothetical protein
MNTGVCHPRCIVIAGPNGAGKTTFAREYLPHAANVVHFVNADLIAAGLSPFQPSLVALSAGRLLVRELDRLATSRRSFAFESTLSGRSYLPRIQRWKAAGYRVPPVGVPAVGPAPHCGASEAGWPRRGAGRRAQAFRTRLVQLPDGLPTDGRCVGGVRQLRDSPDIGGEGPMKAPRKPRQQSFVAEVGRALRRAGAAARRTARMHGTPVYIWRNGRVVAEKP